ncbi:MAG: hypothetical protein UX07_C0040G0011 [Parcubacteria group bacterium GW2011_GWA2_45_30]|nr:MAG: hypothetical protein UX07_C0040G0011 [Parcubacteria group bacterium GW2011_GWA2_45_30]
MIAKKYFLSGGILLFLIVITLLMAGRSSVFEINLGGWQRTDGTPAEDNSKQNNAASDLKDAVSTVDWQTYSNFYAGYTLRYPPAWKVRDSLNGVAGEDIRVVGPGGAAFVRILWTADPSIRGSEEVRASVLTYRQSLAEGKDGTKLSDFESEIIGDYSVKFTASGEFILDDVPYRFEERGEMITGGIMLIKRGAAIPSAFNAMRPIIQTIINSFKPIELQ